MSETTKVRKGTRTYVRWAPATKTVRCVEPTCALSLPADDVDGQDRHLVSAHGWSLADVQALRGAPAAETKEQVAYRLARTHLLVATLTKQNSDSLDFHSLAVWNIQAALEAAFEAGLAAAPRRSVPRSRVTFSQAPYLAAHGSAPRGRGVWCFGPDPTTPVDSPEAFNHNGSFLEACRAASAWYATRGTTLVYVQS